MQAFTFFSLTYKHLSCIPTVLPILLSPCSPLAVSPCFTHPAVLGVLCLWVRS